MSRQPATRDRIGAVVLAAGESRRFGAAKQLAVLAGRTLLEHVLELALSSGLRPVVAVVPVWLTRPAGASDAVTWVRNPYPDRGLSHSLRLGFAALPADVAAAVILLGDQPSLPRESIAAVIAGRGEEPIVAAWAEGRPAPPVLIARSHFDVVEDATGDRGLRDVLLGHPEWVRLVAVPAHVPDIDTPGDLAHLERGDDG